MEPTSERPLQFQPSLNDPAATSWPETVGKLILNFGALELATFQWIAGLAQDLVLVEVMVDAPFVQRCKAVGRLVERRELNADLRAAVSDAWQEAARLAESGTTSRTILSSHCAALGAPGPRMASLSPDSGRL